MREVVEVEQCTILLGMSTQWHARAQSTRTCTRTVNTHMHTHTHNLNQPAGTGTPQEYPIYSKASQAHTCTPSGKLARRLKSASFTTTTPPLLE